MNSVRSMWVMSYTSRPANAIGMAPRPIRQWGISRSHSLAVKPRTDSLAPCSEAWVVPTEGPRAAYVEHFVFPRAGEGCEPQTSPAAGQLMGYKHWSVNLTRQQQVRSRLSARGRRIQTCMGLFLSSGCFGLC